MAAHLTPAQRTTYAPLAWALSLAGLSASAIATELQRQYGISVTEKTIDAFLADERTRVAQQDIPEMERQRDVHAARMERIWQYAWQRIDAGLDPKDEAAFLRVARSAANDVARASGVFVERIDVRTRSEVLIREYVGVDVERV